MHCLKIRELDMGDLDMLSRFIMDAYNDFPLAMWFETKPSQSEIERIFYNKIRSAGLRNLVDIISEDNNVITGECEIAKAGFDLGVIGVIVRKGYRGYNIGSSMLSKAMDNAVDIGITRFMAEVREENKEGLKFFIGNGFAPVGYRDTEGTSGKIRIVVLQKSIR